ncbi:MAG: hypothetical protein K6A92_10735 [Lachnospiraceae bacterium]|nr:hypothetical protein [Lachnospiraceae bacterium]
MKITQEELTALNLPSVACPGIDPRLWKQQLTSLLQKEYLGSVPDLKTLSVSCSIQDENPFWYGGKATRSTLLISAENAYSSHSFPVTVILPHLEQVPVFLHLAFEKNDPFCGEEVLDHGFGIVKVCYTDIEPDDQTDHTDGFAGLMAPDDPDLWGKFGCWAFASSLIYDTLRQFPSIDQKRVAVVGHSRLAMTALYAGVLQPSFSMVGAINSGALHRGTHKETFADLSRDYTRHWFRKDLFTRYSSEEQLPFDNHFLIAACAPAPVYLSAASLDEWCDPSSMAYSGLAASPAFAAWGKKGLLLPEETEENVLYAEGDISYYLRTGTHYFGRDDLLNMMKIRTRRNL